MLKLWVVAVITAFVSTSAIATPASRIPDRNVVTKVGCGVDNRNECCVSDEKMRRAFNCR